MSASLSELVLGWDTHFELDRFYVHPDHYRRTFRAWALALRTRADRATQLLGPDRYRTFARYFAGGEALFRLRQQTLYRAILTRRPEPKHWAVTVRPSDLDSVHDSAQGASPTAVEAHYDLSNAFYRLWLGPTMMYSSGMWEDVDDLESSLRHKVDFFSQALHLDAWDRVLDVGCGWGWALRRLVREHEISDVTGLTLSKAQHDFVAADPVVGADVRLEDWKDHRPTTPYDAIMSFGAFEHFARDGSTGPERIAAYRRFFESCSDWLVPGGRLALETIAHDDAPDTDAPLGRGPLGDSVLSLYPESLCPHLSEVVLGFEPFFELDVLRSDGQDFARTCREWLLALRRREQEATELVGPATVRTFQSYLAASEIQFRTRIITNYRIVLRRRPDRRH
jgi:cyclopropane-fatty-acyl-phospholipid synthase